MASRARIPTPDRIFRPRDRENASPSLNCCCGSHGCSLLRRNYSILGSVEKDVHTAAQLGQAILARHETFMADAERERLDLNERIERLEMDKHNLEIENANTVEENRGLLEQLEALNHSLSDSDVKIKNLESSLLSAQQAVRRLEAAANRAQDAERHLAALEEETDKLLTELRASKEDHRTQIQRYKEAQRELMDMQDQLERIEIEARQERQHYAETVERLERQREIEKQLDAAAGRLKGAAATKNVQHHKHDSRVIEHFVRDLLQDNANLQLGIREMRELLMNSNDEIQSLRDELMPHQPAMSGSADVTSTLRTELEPEYRSSSSQQLHIHHHYHVAKHDHRKPKKKRQGLFPRVVDPIRTSSPYQRHSSQWGSASSSTASALLCRLPEGEEYRTQSKSGSVWDERSQTASDLYSSVPSSPQTHHQRLFDAGHNDSDPVLSPTTSYDPLSPAWPPRHHKRPSVSSTHSFQSLAMSILDPAPNTPSPKEAHAMHAMYARNVIAEEDEDVQSLPPLRKLSPAKLTMESLTSMNETSAQRHPAFVKELLPRSRLRCVSSYESIMSLAGGLDIHTLKSRPSQMTLRSLSGADAVVTGLIARPTLSCSTAKRSDAVLRDKFARSRPSRSVSPFAVTRLPSSPSPSATVTLGKVVGWRPWGGGASASSPQTSCPSVITADTDIRGNRGFHRAPGINQPGAIPGFPQYWSSRKRKGAPAKVTADRIDRDALIDILQE
ncbi:hypothetical protein E4U40_003384 [Claviceps sp. LM458 group G5]|nr:hypothetical protein E4U40_003384 [Claviceps sp. LM458 group G5]